MTSRDPADAFPTFDTREKIDGLALKTCEKATGGVSPQDKRRKKTKEMETWPKPQSVRNIQVFLGFRGLIGDLESQCHSPRCFEQLTNQLAISLRVSRPKSRMHQVLVVLVVLVVLMELVEVTKICQVPGSWKIGLGPSGTDFRTLGSNEELLTGGVLSQLTTKRGIAGQVTHKTSNSSKV